MDETHPTRRWVAVLLAVVAAVGIGAVAYQAGLAHGMTQQVVAQQGLGQQGLGQQGAVGPYPYHYGPWRVGFFGPFFGILFFFLFLRLLFWGLFGWGWGWRRRWYYDYPGGGPYGPPAFDDWHRRAHERMRNGGTDTTSAPAST